ncbi:hypothetical protein RQP46_005297 [Phenoliferia psychrophenolica]
MVTRQVESSFINPGYQGDNSEEPLFQVVNRYSPRASRTVADGAPKTSLVLIHGTMLCKELWEPTIADLLAEGEVLDEVWALDTYNSGQSSLVNQDLLGYTLAWEDYGRDIVAFLRSPIFQQSPESGINPTLHHHRPRKVLGVGHSFGGTALLFSAAMDPSLFTSIILLEPVAAFGEWSAAEHASRSLKRRSEWPSREAAREQWLASPRFQRWDPRSFDRYVRFGLLEKDDGTVTLSTKKEDEAVSFLQLLVADFSDLPDAVSDQVQFASPNGYGAELATKVFSTLPSTLPVTVLYADHPGSLAPDVALESLRAANPPMPFFKSSNASKASVASSSSSAPLHPRESSIFDSSSPKSPLYSPNYQVPVHSLADSIEILRRNSPPSSSKNNKKASKEDNAMWEQVVAEENARSS